MLFGCPSAYSVVQVDVVGFFQCPSACSVVRVDVMVFSVFFSGWVECCGF